MQLLAMRFLLFACILFTLDGVGACSCHPTCSSCGNPSENCECYDCWDSNAYKRPFDCRCNDGWYGPATVASPCQACQACTGNTYRTGCSGTNAGSCASCDTCPGGQYKTGCGGFEAGTCNTCATCSGERYRSGCGGLSAGTCADCTCSAGQYKTGGCSGEANAVCSDCRSCGSGEYETAPCTYSSNRVCSACTCPVETFRTGGCSGTSNAVCSACTTCSSTEYETTACTYSTNRQCSPCSCPTNTYKTGGCSGTSDATCSSCTTCNVGQRESVPCTYSSDRVCVATRCTSPPTAPTNGHVAFSNFDNHGSQASFSCQTGRKCVSCGTVTCNAPSSNMPWPSASPSCPLTACTSPPEAPANGDVSFSDGNRHGSVATFTCTTGFKGTGSPSVSCSAAFADAPWPTSDAACVRNQCSAGTRPAAPPNGEITFSDADFHGSVATITCNDGYIVSGSETITCSAPSSDGAWPASSTTCADSGCTNNPSPDPNGYVSYSDGSLHNSVATFNCNSGYTRGGTTSITCNAPSGSQPWPPSSPTCTDTDGCVGHNNCASADVGATCTDLPPPSTGYSCECSPGFTFSNGACSECAAGTYKDTTGPGACSSCHPEASSPPRSTSAEGCACNEGFYGNGLDCTECSSDPNCAVDGTGCAGSGPYRRCVDANPGYYVDSSGSVVECAGVCATCVDGTSCETCVDGNATVVPGDLCECNAGFFLVGIACSEVNPCEGSRCDAGGDAGGECVALSFAEIVCTCSPGYGDSDGVCQDIDGCTGEDCTAGGDSGATCLDMRPPSTGFSCVCSPGFVDVGGTCQACNDGCRVCAADLTCTECFSDDAAITPAQTCECNTGFYWDGTDCLNCQVAIAGCSACSSASACLSCAVGTLSPDGASCVSEGSTQVIDGDGASSEGGDSDSALLGALVATSVVMTCLCVAILVLVVARRPKKNRFSFDGNKTSESTVQIDGASFGDYIKKQIDSSKPIATGGFGAVYKVKLENGVDVALKVLNPDADMSAQAEFHRECTILTKLTVLNSPLIVAMTCFCEDPVCVGMEFASNGTLFDRLKKGPLSGEALYTTAKESAAPLEFLHRKNFAHLDVKPQNFLVMENDRVVICDFGLSIEVGETMPSNNGTPQYLAPERYFRATSVNGDTRNVVELADPRACDVFSWAIMMCAFANGESPFSKIPASNIATLIAEKDVRPGVPDDADPWFESLLKKCWSRDPTARPSMRDVMAALQNALDPEATALVTASECSASIASQEPRVSYVTLDSAP